MLGLALGSWQGGKFVRFMRIRGLSPLYIYAFAEFFIGLGAFIVPEFFGYSSNFLSTLGELNSKYYLVISALFISGSILPWCFAMGMTYPLVMAYIEDEKFNYRSSFSYLYLANVIGAMLGAVTTAFIIIELLGFHKTLFVGASFNFFIALLSFYLAIRSSRPLQESSKKENDPLTNKDSSPKRLGYSMLFLTGFTSMAMEVIWTRAFTPIIETTIYAFASLLATYLLATWIGSLLYRYHLKENKIWSLSELLPYIAVSSILPLILNDPHFNPGIPTVLFSIFPFCGILGYLTPKLIDEYSSGVPNSAGCIYAINIVGCILGPLLAGYVLLPFLGVKSSLLLMALPFFIFLFRPRVKLSQQTNVTRVLSLLVVGFAIFFIRTYEDPTLYDKAEIRRDYTATIISSGEEMDKQLLVNGIGITVLTPITKVMAHLPLSHLQVQPQSALAICFGMGTTFRSLFSWGIDVTAVELVPSVKKAFPYYFDDAKDILLSPRARVIIDDGRRFLKRSKDIFDVITLDPPPPVEASGSSLLYSYEFYQDVKKHLRPGGILQQWFPSGEEKILQAVTRSLVRAFPYVRVFNSVEDWGFHFLASDQPIETITPKKMFTRMPDTAKKDLMEWYPGETIEEIMAEILKREVSLKQVLSSDKNIEVTDDKAFNEYFMLRRHMKF